MIPGLVLILIGLFLLLSVRRGAERYVRWNALLGQEVDEGSYKIAMPVVAVIFIVIGLLLCFGIVKTR
jgi:hypothetical protein